MPTIRILTERELKDCVALDHDALACIEDCFRVLATEDVVMPPILRLDIAQHNGEVDVKTAYLPGLPSFAIKVSPGFFDNPKLGLPSVNGLMLLLSARTGLVERPGTTAVVVSGCNIDMALHARLIRGEAVEPGG